MVGSVRAAFAATWVLALVLGCAGIAAADANAGARLVAQNGCQSCHGAKFQGGSSFPALYGIEHRRSHAQIVSAILRPKAPMPNYGFTTTQASDIADYLASLDGGATANGPVITIAPAHPSDYADVTIRFRGAPPKSITAVASLAMGSTPMKSPKVTFKPTSDPHVFTGRVEFLMSGSWTIHIVYDGNTINQTVVVGQ